MPTRLSVFAYADTEKSHLYRLVMRAFTAAKQTFALHLRPEDVHAYVLEILGAEVDIDLEEVRAALSQLERWGNVSSSADTSAVSTLEDFYRERRLYQATREGEAAEAALAFYEEQLRDPGELQATALDDIRQHLEEVRRLCVEDDEWDDAKAAAAMAGLRRRFETLTAKAQVFLGGLRRAVELQTGGWLELLEYKRELIDYLERFVRQLIVQRGAIARLIVAFEPMDVARLCKASAAHETRDRLDQELAVSLAAEEWQGRWAGLRRWFVGGDGRPAQVAQLQARARSAIPAFLNAVAALHERRASATDRKADYRALARWFAETSSPNDAHQLYHVAFGLSSCRHLRINHESLDALLDDIVSHDLEWLRQPVLRLTPRLRTTGRHDRRGPAKKTVDRSKARAHLAELAAAEAKQLEEARRVLDLGRRRLSELPTLDSEAFNLFLDLLASALARQDSPERRVETPSMDGTFVVCLEPVPGAPEVSIITTTGTLRGADAWFELRSPHRGASR